MTCQKIDPLVERYVDGQLSPALAAAVRSHERGCARCARRIEAARLLLRTLAAEPEPRAPVRFEERVMGAVYREALHGAARAGPPESPAIRPRSAWGQRAGVLVFRRLGFSLVLTALVLALSLLIPRVAYPTLMGSGEAGIAAQDSVGIVKSTFDGAQQAVRGILGEPTAATSQNGGRLR